MADRTNPTTPETVLREARRREKISQAQWRRQRAEVARLVAAGEEEAAEKLLAQAGIELSGSEWARLADHATPIAEQPREPSSRDELAKRELASSGEQPFAASAPVKSKPTRPAAATRQPTAPKFTKPKTRRRREPKTWAFWLKNRPPWMISLVVHSVLILGLGLLSFATLSEPAFSLSMAMDEAAHEDEMPSEVTFANFESDAQQELAEPVEAAPDLSQALELATLAEPVTLESAIDIGDVMAISAESLAAVASDSAGGDDGAGEATEASATEPAGKPGRVSFFGAESRAERIIFVVDNSGTMQRGRMETTLMELERAIARLSTSQQFYVVFYSDQAYPMFYPAGVDEPIQATRPNKQKLSAWLRTVEICLGGRLLDAMELAARLEPDVVFLLSDGDIRSSRVTERMTSPEAWEFTIHTLGMGARLPQHAQLLGAIAQANGGVFRPVVAHPAAVARSRIKPIPYHRETGTTWGSAVQSWD